MKWLFNEKYNTELSLTRAPNEAVKVILLRKLYRYLAEEETKERERERLLINIMLLRRLRA